MPPCRCEFTSRSSNLTLPKATYKTSPTIYTPIGANLLCTHLTPLYYKPIETLSQIENSVLNDLQIVTFIYKKSLYHLISSLTPCLTTTCAL